MLNVCVYWGGKGIGVDYSEGILVKHCSKFCPRFEVQNCLKLQFQDISPLKENHIVYYCTFAFVQVH